MPRRRPKPAPKSQFVGLRLTSAEAQLLDDKAEAAGLSRSELLRVALRDARVVGQVRRQEEHERRMAVNRVGNSINQVARWANTHKASGEALVVVDALVQVDAMIRALAAGEDLGDLGVHIPDAR